MTRIWKGLGSVNKVAEEKAKIFQGSGNLSKIFFPESCTAFTPFEESNLEGRDYMILKSGDPSDHKIEKKKPTLTFGLKQKQTGARRRFGFGVTSPHFFP